MEYNSKLNLVCPIRGLLKVNKKSKDGLTPTEESFRIEAIRFLLSLGYPKENFLIEPVIKRFGNNGRNSFRSDFAILDTSVSSIDVSSPDEILAHALIIGEIKRSHEKNNIVLDTQVRPMLDFATNQNTIGVYWDNIDKRVFWIEIKDNIKEIKEGPISFLPRFGNTIKTTPLTFDTIEPCDSLLDAFSKIEDILHQASFAPEKRYEIILQLLLAKIFDEHAFETRPTEALEFQDYVSLGCSVSTSFSKINELVKRAVNFYGRHLPNKISDKLPISDDTLCLICKTLAPIKIIHSKRDVVQTFYMKFAKDLYKWDMAQYFTPTTVTDFLVNIINPQFGEHIADPACGSADFLVAAFRIARKYNPGFADCIWGIDNSSNAVQVAVLNMVLNGDGKTNIIKDDTLENASNYIEHFDIITCNPPFGSKILEKRKSVLRQFDLGFEWLDAEQMGLHKTDSLLDKQETGILFLELCVKLCRPGGRIAIILPNGYLGNRSHKFKVVRNWLLKHTRIATIISLPRFTFKSSGADVSASVLYLEKRTSPIEHFEDDNVYKFAVEAIERIGWEAGNKKATPIYKKDSTDGSLIIDTTGEPIIDCDFDDAINRIIASDATLHFPWLCRGKEINPNVEGWSVGIDLIYSDPDLTLDPKRLGQKALSLRESIESLPHLCLDDIVDFIPEKKSSAGTTIKAIPSEQYNYVEIQNIGHGDFYSTHLKGWELPDRAKHFAEAGDIYFGSIWGSATKWCIIPETCNNIVVTNGCFRCRIKHGAEQYLTDLLSYMNSEGWAVQLRSLARGSDGLAEIWDGDAKKVLIPILSEDLRKELRPYVNNLIKGHATLHSLIKQKLNNNEIEYSDPEKRPSHIVLV